MSHLPIAVLRKATLSHEMGMPFQKRSDGERFGNDGLTGQRLLSAYRQTVLKMSSASESVSKNKPSLSK